MKWAFVIALLVASASSAEQEAKPEFTHIDKEVAFAYGLAMLKESYKSRNYRNSKVPMGELDLNDGTVREAVDGNGRVFAYVAFKSKRNQNAGFYVVLEFCGGRLGEYTPSYSSDVLDLSQTELEFLSADNDPTADFPGDCTHGL